MANILSESGIDFIYHVAPLHYLPFIARSSCLKSKVTLLAEGFSESHFRSKSKHLDRERGFGDYIHLSTEQFPPILKAKLFSGFPHISISIPSAALGNLEFDICRYNVAMTRKLRRCSKPGFPEAPENGRYYDGKQIPIARTGEEQLQLIAAQTGKMLEVLVKPPLKLPQGTSVKVFNPVDREASNQVLSGLKLDWPVYLSNTSFYHPREDYFEKCHAFLSQSLNDPNWLGDGLEFDKV